MKLAILYAGQGSQHPGMGRDLYEAFPAYRAAFDGASLPFDLKEVSWEDRAGVLGETQYTQPCMVAFAAGVTAVLRGAGVRPALVGGLSLGEYSALEAAGVFSAKTAVELAAFRGEEMRRAAEGVESAMTAVLMLDRESLEDCCARAREAGVVQICNDNCPGQLVIGGEAAAVKKAAALALEAGARRCLPLAVSGPFHTSLMRPAGEALRRKFETLIFAEPEIPVLFNVLGGLNTEGEAIPSLLVRQVQSGVRMREMLESLVQQGVDTVLEVGPGRVLSGFVKKTCGGAVRCIPVETARELTEALAVLKGETA